VPKLCFGKFLHVRTLAAKLFVSTQPAPFLSVHLYGDRHVSVSLLYSYKATPACCKQATEDKVGSPVNFADYSRGKAETEQKVQLEYASSMTHPDSMRTNGCFTAKVKAKPSFKGQCM
jgi:hypothetical protein